MDDIILKNAPPIISKWIIKYDEYFGLPQYIQGKLLNDYKEFEANSNIILDNIIFTDLKNKIVITTTNEKFILAGKGRSIILLDNELPQTEWDLYEEEIDETDPI